MVRRIFSRGGVAALAVLFSTIAFGQSSPTTTPAPSPTPAPAPEVVTPELRDKVLAGLADVVTKRAFVPGVDFAKWPEFVEKQREAIDKAETPAALVRELNRALREFGISHISLRAPRAAAARTRTTMVGVGVTTTRNDEGLAIMAVAPNSPAAQAGLEAGDIILLVAGNKPQDPEALRVEAGQKLSLKVKKRNGETKDLELEARQFSTVRPETLTWHGEDAAVLRIWTFSNGYSRENIEKLMREASKAKYLVLDLRNNGGGAVVNMNHLLSLFLPDRTDFGTFVRRATFEEYQKAKPDAPTDLISIAQWATGKSQTRRRSVEPFAGKVAVLINRGSASASEITAAALREKGNAVLVGAPTRGAVLASVYARLEGGYELQYPISDYVTINGMRLEGNPLKPDIEITGPGEPGKDAALEAALARLRGA